MLYFVYDLSYYIFFQITWLILWISLFTIATPLYPVYNFETDEDVFSTKKNKISKKKTSNSKELKSRQNVMLVLLSLEMGIASVCLLSLVYSIYIPTIFGHIIIIILIVLAGAESALGLALLMIIYKIHSMISFDTLYVLKG